MHDPALFKWRHFQADIIVCAVRWYLRYALRYRDVEELLRERGVWVDHTTVFRWVQRYAPALEKRCRPLLKATHDSYRVDETYIKIKKQWYDLYRAVDSEGNTIEFRLSATRDAEAADRFFRVLLQILLPHDARQGKRRFQHYLLILFYKAGIEVQLTGLLPHTGVDFVGLTGQMGRQ